MQRATQLLLCCAPLLVGCGHHRDSKPESYRTAYESDLTSARIALDALNALSSGDTNRATYLLQVEVFLTAYSLPRIAKEGSLPVEAQTNGEAYAKSVLTYLEYNVSSIDPKLPMTQHCIEGLHGLLISDEDKSRLQELEQQLQKGNVEPSAPANGASPHR